LATRCFGTLLPGKSLLNGISISNFRHEDGFKINNKYFPAISRTLYLSTETISRPQQSHETIPLKEGFNDFQNLSFKSYDFVTWGLSDVKPVFSNLQVSWRSAGPYSKPTQHVAKEYIIS
jgi:hypothetical protein